jgi:uncharacterized pyridoxal phosphate-containing UPF0001 family protein
MNAVVSVYCTHVFKRIGQHAVGQSCEMEEYVDNTRKTLKKTDIETSNVGQIQEEKSRKVINLAQNLSF